MKTIINQPLQTNCQPKIIKVTYCLKGNFLSFQTTLIICTSLKVLLNIAGIPRMSKRLI